RLLDAETGDEARADRQLRGRQVECFQSQLPRHAVQLEQDTARLDAADVEFGVALAAAHAHLGRLHRHRHVRKDVDPDTADAADVAGDGAACSLDLARGNAAGLGRLEAIGAVGQGVAAGGKPMDAPLVRLAVFAACRLKHDRRALNLFLYARAGCASAARLSWAIGSCASTSPLNTHTL